MGNKLKKILYVEDLIKLCQEQKMTTFSAKDNGYQLCVQVPAMFEENENEDDSLLYLTLKTSHIGLNRNNSFISENNAERCMSTLKYKPILANTKEIDDDGTLDFTSHDMEEDENGNTIYIEKQVGCFTSDEPYLQYDENEDKTYIMANAVIPREYTKTADIIERKGGTKVSVELAINDMSFNAEENYLELNDFVYCGCTLLGEDVGEGMKGARADIADFSMENNSICSNTDTNNFMIEILEKLEHLESTVSSFNNISQNSKEGGNENLSKFEELMEKYGVTEEEITFDTTDLSDDELEAKFEEVFGEDTSSDDEGDNDDSTEEFSKVCPECGATIEDDEATVCPECGAELDTESDDSTEEDEACGSGGSKKKKKNALLNVDGKEYTFELSMNETVRALEILVNDTYSESDNAYYCVQAFDDSVVMIDYWTGRAYKQSYKSEDNVFTLVGDREEVYANYLTKAEESALEEMRSNYSAIETELNTYKEAEIKEKKESVFADEAYADYLENEDFVSLKDNMDKYSVDELKEKAELAFAKCVKEVGTFSKKTEKKPNKVAFDLGGDSEEYEPYGDLFKKYEK